MYYVKKISLLKATGRDVLDLINRLSSNELNDLNPGQNRKTILLNEKGRIVDLINVFRLSDKFFIEGSEGKEDQIIKYFDKYTFMEDVKFVKEEDNEKLIFIGELDRYYNNLHDEGAPVLTRINNDNDLLIYKDNFKFNSLNVISKEETINEISASLEINESMSRDDFEEFRIKKGLPEKELNENINPLECGLGEFISYSKGCYIGQEVIARLDAQKKIPKQMIYFKADDMVRESDKIFTEEGKEAGFVSSMVENPGSSGVSSEGLGFIRSMSLDFGKKYFVESDNKKISTDISKLNNHNNE